MLIYGWPCQLLQLSTVPCCVSARHSCPFIKTRIASSTTVHWFELLYKGIISFFNPFWWLKSVPWSSESVCTSIMPYSFLVYWRLVKHNWCLNSFGTIKLCRNWKCKFSGLEYYRFYVCFSILITWTWTKISARTAFPK